MKRILAVIFILLSISCSKDVSTEIDSLNSETTKCNYKFKCSYDINILNDFGKGPIGCGSETNPTKNPIGGGLGFYKDMSIACISNKVYNTNELISAIKNAQDGDIIYLDDESIFDLTNLPTIKVNNSIIIMSGRGINNSNGALIIDKNQYLGNQKIANSKTSIFKISSNLVQFTGIRISGPHPNKIDPSIRSMAILINNSNCVEIENMEIENFSHAAIAYVNSKNGYVHHNYIHNSQGIRLGYGVLLNGESEVLIEANLFKDNRHDISGTGHLGQKYEARYNLDLRNSTDNFSRSFDMHGRDEKNCASSSNVGGSTIVIHHNTFLDNRDESILLRGHPQFGAWISNNIFPTSTREESLRQPSCDIEQVYWNSNCFN
ncbi:right-handed parallel beta-helix repeat-containing protein [Maribacter sp. BPC-D8]|uniref:hypothetical protein n=1 Tax=Maribacter sp. BPC-D8 TaxID=3053613 RepID=UPI002B47993B|nr:hypothetical protein [Maribacter sp. BPC-D8]WRI29492.1 right-handed parallel beta-helix repeat-containing protein [Maribacter sp. BPC-D8]